MTSEFEARDGNAKLFLSPAKERWVEQRFEWLIATFGIEKLWNAPFLTLCPEDFPDPYAGVEADAEVVFSRICEYMGLNVQRLKLRFYSGDDHLECELAEIPTNAAGLYQYDQEKPTVWLDRFLLENSELLIAVIAHELSHEILLGQKLLDVTQDKDHEKVTDLLTLYLGWGVFTGNTYLPRKRWFQDSLETSNRSRLGYLSLGELGYSLALVAWHRNETDAPWMRALTPKLRTLVSQNLQRVITSRGTVTPGPNTLHSEIAERVRAIPTSALLHPELVPIDFKTDNYLTMVRVLCRKCKAIQEVSIEFAGHTVSCPTCENYLDVPNPRAGRRAALTSQWNLRNEQELHWQRNKLTQRWRNYYIFLCLTIGCVYWLCDHQDWATSTIVLFLVGAGLGSYFTGRWYDLKALEHGSPNSIPSKE